MIKLLDKSNISIFTYLYVFCFIAIYAGHATVFARNLGDIRTVGNTFALILTIVFVLVKKISFKMDYFLVLGVFLLYAFITAFAYKNLNWWWISVRFFFITYAYVISKATCSHLITLFETILYHLTIIALFFWVIMLVSPGLLDIIVHTFHFSEPLAEDGNVDANMIIYTLPNYEYGIHDFRLSFFRRNPGFMWEPGAFASMLCVAIFCNILRKKGLVLTNNSVLWVFLIALFSTQSTTGFAVFFIMLFVLLFTTRKFGWAIIVIPLAVILFTSLSFFGDKLLHEQEMLQYKDVMNTQGQQGRFFSLVLDWQEFLRHPVLGLGCNWQDTWLAQNGFEISTVSGIGDLLSTYGAVIAVLFLCMTYKTCLVIDREYDTKNGFLLIPVILGIMVSYAMWLYPIFIAIWMYGIWEPYSQRQGNIYCS